MQTAVMAHDPNPFRIAGELLPGEMIDREDTAHRLLGLAVGGHASRLVAPRRYGKTSLLRRVLTARLYENGLLCRLDDRGDPVIQISPPLVADQKLLGRIVDILGDAVEYAWGEVQKGMPKS